MFSYFNSYYSGLPRRGTYVGSPYNECRSYMNMNMSDKVSLTSIRVVSLPSGRWLQGMSSIVQSFLLFQLLVGFRLAFRPPSGTQTMQVFDLARSALAWLS